jgi:recombinational DNA repair protein (RecF pathway)
MKQRGADESRCASCGERIVGTKAASEEHGVLCIPCARELHPIPLSTYRLVRVGRTERDGSE